MPAKKVKNSPSKIVMLTLTLRACNTVMLAFSSKHYGAQNLVTLNSKAKLWRTNRKAPSTDTGDSFFPLGPLGRAVN